MNAVQNKQENKSKKRDDIIDIQTLYTYYSQIPLIKEIDLNPVIAYEEDKGVAVVDGRMKLRVIK